MALLEDNLMKAEVDLLKIQYVNDNTNETNYKEIWLGGNW